MPSSHPRRSTLQPALAVGGALLWGAVELVALCRARWLHRIAELRHGPQR